MKENLFNDACPEPELNTYSPKHNVFPKLLSVIMTGAFIFMLGFFNTPASAHGCHGSSDCDDGDPCTWDGCRHGMCYHKSVVHLDFIFDRHICAGEPVYIRNNSRGVDPGATYYLDLDSDGSIDFSAPAASLPEDSSVVLPVTGSIDFTIIVVNPSGCSDSLDASITVTDCDDNNPCTLDRCHHGFCWHEPAPSLKFDYDRWICVGESVRIKNESEGVDPGATYYLDLDSDGSIDFSAPASSLPGDSTVVLPFDSTTDLTIIVVNPDGCSDSLDVTIHVNNCDDGDPCTVDICGPFGCYHQPMDCDDNNPCTIDSCGGGVCFNTPRCDDGDPCTVDTCIVRNHWYGNGFRHGGSHHGGHWGQVVVCQHYGPELAFDYDEYVCVGDSVTIVNKSRGIDPGATYYLDIGSDGTVDFSASASSLPNDSTVVLPFTTTTDFTVIVVNPGGCSDSLDATINFLNCDDGDDCTIDFCGPNGCRHVPMDCDDNNPCTIDSCGGGVCFNTPRCDDGDPCTVDTCMVSYVWQGGGHNGHGHGNGWGHWRGNGHWEEVVVCKHLGPELRFRYDSPVCVGDEVYIKNNSIGIDPGATYHLDVGSDGTIDFSVPASSLPDDSSVVLPFTSDVDFTVIVVNPGGCSDSLEASISFVSCDDGDPCTEDICEDGVCTHRPAIHVDLGPDQTVYSGYAGADCADITATVSGGAAPYSYVWSTGDATSSVTVCPTSRTEYCVTVTDANGCSAESCVDVCVENVRCSWYRPKVIICHKTPWGRDQTLCVDSSAVAAHLAHGDELGACKSNHCDDHHGNHGGWHKTGESDLIDNMGAEVIFSAYPNPFKEELNIEFTFSEDTKVTLEIYNVAGQKLATLFDGTVKASELQTMQYRPTEASGNVIIYRLKTEKGTYIDKAVLMR